MSWGFNKRALHILIASTLLVLISMITTVIVIHAEKHPNLVYINGHYVFNATGQPIVLVNNAQAHDPSWEELMTFLKSDMTDEQYYNESFVCTNYAEMLQNNAEAAGIRAGFVYIYFKQGICSVPNESTVCPMVCNFAEHACNAFQTTDKGLVYIDDTGAVSGQGVDCIANISVGHNYVRVPLFSNVSLCLMKEVSNFSVVW